AIAAALGYAWFLARQGETEIVAARAGHLAPQTQAALRRFEQSAPVLLSGVAPTFAHAARPSETVLPDAPLSAALGCMACGAGVARVVGEDGARDGVATPMGVARAVAAGNSGLSRPCSESAEAVPVITARERISDHRGVLLRSEVDDFLVTDAAG